MAYTANFDTPKTASGRYIDVVGTVPANTTFVEVMQLSVCRYNANTEYFYLSKEYSNKTTSPSAVSESLIIAVVPIIAVGASADSVTFTAFGAIEGQVDLAVGP